MKKETHKERVAEKIENDIEFSETLFRTVSKS
jgi:hypothetical protein